MNRHLTAAAFCALLALQSTCCMAGPPPAPTPPADPVGSDIVPAPKWAELPASSRETLAPLASQFDELPAQQRRKWISLASRSASWTPEKRKMIQSRMVQWASMTPEQRAAARQQALAAGGTRAQSWAKWNGMEDGAKAELHGKALGVKPSTAPAGATPSP